MKNLIYTLCILLLIGSCSSPRKLIEKAKYNQAIDKLIHGLAGKKNKSTEAIRQLELAFSKAQEEDLYHEKELLIEQDESKWEKVYALYNSIEERQNKIKPLLPLVSKDAYQASFNFINTLEKKKESKYNSIEYYYNTATEKLELSKQTGRHKDAIEANEYLLKIESLTSNYKDVSQLKNLAKNLGTSHYLVKVTNNTFKIFPVQLEDHLLDISVTDLNRAWKQFDMHKQDNIKYDFIINLNLTNLEFSPEREKSKVIEDESEEVISEIKKDKNGNVIKDSVGHPIKIEKTIKHSSQIEQTIQSKSCLLSGQIEWYNTFTKNIDRTEPLNVEINFQNEYGRLMSGEFSKMSKTGKKLVKGSSTVFPTNEQMASDASDKMKEIVKGIINRIES